MISRSWHWYKTRLKRQPLVMTIISGSIVYGVVFGGVLVALLFVSNSFEYQAMCALCATVALGYHWVMTRYQTESSLAQALHLLIAFAFIFFALAISVRVLLLME